MQPFISKGSLSKSSAHIANRCIRTAMTKLSLNESPAKLLVTKNKLIIPIEMSVDPLVAPFEAAPAEGPRFKQAATKPQRKIEKTSTLKKNMNENEIELDNSNEQYVSQAYEQPLRSSHRNQAQPEYEEIGIRHPCEICNRKFADLARLEKHVLACQKVQKPRKAFDASKARVRGTELEQFAKNASLIKAKGKGKKDEEESIPIPKKNWKAKHDRFLQMVRSAKNPDGAPAQSLPNDDLVLCEYCNRRFNEDSAQKHIPICKDIKLKAQYRSNNKSVSAKDSTYKIRMQYKPPVPKTKAAQPTSQSNSPTRK